MDLSIAAILIQDGWTNGAVYALVALALVLVFSVTRIIFIPQGELLAFSALTLAGLQAGQFPKVIWLLLLLGGMVFLLDLLSALRGLRRAEAWPPLHGLGMSALKNVAYPLAALLTVQSLELHALTGLTTLALTFFLIAPLGAMLYRLVFQPVADSSVLLLLIIAVGLHFVLLGCGLLMFGPEGARAEPFTAATFQWGDLLVTGQSLAVVLVSLVLIGVLYVYFEFTIDGTALRATAINRLGARLVGIGASRSGRMAFSLASVLATIAGLLIAPITTMQYDTGFVIALKGFVAAIVGALSSYPGAALGALFVGLVESFGSFWASAYKEVIVFTMIIPVLVWRSMTASHVEET